MYNIKNRGSDALGKYKSILYSVLDIYRNNCKLSFEYKHLCFSLNKQRFIPYLINESTVIIKEQISKGIIKQIIIFILHSNISCCFTLVYKHCTTIIYLDRFDVNIFDAILML